MFRTVAAALRTEYVISRSAQQIERDLARAVYGTTPRITNKVRSLARLPRLCRCTKRFTDSQHNALGSLLVQAQTDAQSGLLRGVSWAPLWLS
jgi:hypothetical protein